MFSSYGQGKHSEQLRWVYVRVATKVMECIFFLGGLCYLGIKNSFVQISSYSLISVFRHPGALGHRCPEHSVTLTISRTRVFAFVYIFISVKIIHITAWMWDKNKLGLSPTLMKSASFSAWHSQFQKLPCSSKIPPFLLWHQVCPTFCILNLKFNSPLEFTQKTTMSLFLNPMDRNHVMYFHPCFH